MTAAVQEALELDKVESHLHPEGSFDVEAHEVPKGREEIWRFTPLKRLKGIHNDAPFADGATKVEVEAAAGVTVETVAADDAVRGSSGLVPTDRVRRGPGRPAPVRPSCGSRPTPSSRARP